MMAQWQTAFMASVAWAALAVAAHAQPPAAPPAPLPVATAKVASAPTASGEANMGLLVTDAGNPADSRILGTAALGGIELYSLDGARTGAVPAGEVVALDVRYGFPIGDAPATLVVAGDVTDNSLRFFQFVGGTLRDIGARAVPLDFAIEGVCLFHNAQDNLFYAIAVGDGGEIDQLMLYVTPEGRVDARQSRRLNLSSPVGHCTADDATGQLYLSHEAVGIWRFNGDPEADAKPELVDAVRLGNVTEELAGITLYDGGPDAAWLIASDATAGRLLVYDHRKDDSFVGAVTIAGTDGAAVGEPKGLFATSQPLGAALGKGGLLVADEDGPNYKLVAFDAIATSLNIALGTPPPVGVYAPPAFPIITARVETQPVASSGDAADDVAIWANPTDPAASVVIGTDKRGGLELYDMKGAVLQRVRDGKMNNVDLREGFMLGGKPVVLVTASDRTNKAVAIYMLDTTNRQLVNVADGIQPAGLPDPYGQCMYRSARSGKYYVFINDGDGAMKQWELIATKAGKVRTKLVREFSFDSQPEGCVADDQSGTLYVNEEDVGMWRLGAEPSDKKPKISVVTVAANPKIKDDMEGVGIYHLDGGRGYVVASSQGNNSYAVFRLEGDNAYLGSFAVAADGASGIDGISETDGLEISSANLGAGFEKGAMIAQDGRNMLPSETQNFKYVSWTDIAAVLNLETR